MYDEDMIRRSWVDLAQRVNEFSDALSGGNRKMERMTKRDELLAVIAQAQSALASLAVVPEVDDYPDLTMIRAVVTTPSGGEFVYLLLKVIDESVTKDRYGKVRYPVRWYSTGRPGSMTWDELIRHLTYDRSVTSWEPLIAALEIPAPDLLHTAPIHPSDKLIFEVGERDVTVKAGMTYEVRADADGRFVLR